MKRGYWVGVAAFCLMLLPGNMQPAYAAENSNGGHWQQEERGKKFINADDTNPAGQWWLVDGAWYLFDNNGYALKGWQKQGEIWYYFNEQGAMHTGWLKQEDQWYYLAPGGHMMVGWLKDNEKWYYFDGSGVMQRDWIEVDKKWYYLNQDGSMAIGNKTFDGTIYKFEATGALKTSYISSDEPFGGYGVISYNDNEQAVLDYINDIRSDHDRKSLTAVEFYNEIADFRCESALKYGYNASKKTITGQGDIKTYLKSIKKPVSGTCTEVYLSRAASVEAALERFTTNSSTSGIAKNLFENNTYSKIGISVVEQRDYYYVLMILVK